MTLMEMLIVAHLIGDWLLQTESEALQKFNGKFLNSPLISHCTKYTLAFIPAFYYFGISWYWLILIFWSHMFLDRRWPVKWWIHNVMGNSYESIDKLFWLVVVVDQVMHILVLALIAFFC